MLDNDLVSMVTVFEVQRDGLIGAVTDVYKRQGSSPSVEIEVTNSLDINSDTGFSVAVPELRLKTKIQNWKNRHRNHRYCC